MTQIASDYAKEFIIGQATPVDYVAYYFKMARQLGDVAEYYNRSMTEDIFLGYSAVGQMIESLAIIYKNNINQTDIISAKESIYNEFQTLILDLESYFGSYPDEITQRDITNGKMLALGFSSQS